MLKLAVGFQDLLAELPHSTTKQIKGEINNLFRIEKTTLCANLLRKLILNSAPELERNCYLLLSRPAQAEQRGFVGKDRMPQPSRPSVCPR